MSRVVTVASLSGEESIETTWHHAARVYVAPLGNDRYRVRVLGHSVVLRGSARVRVVA